MEGHSSLDSINLRAWPVRVLVAGLLLLGTSLAGFSEERISANQIALSYAFEDSSALHAPGGPSNRASAEATLDEAIRVDRILSETDAFQATSEHELNFGFDNRTLWVRLVVSNPTDKQADLYLDIDFPPLDQVIFYETENDLILRTLVSGDMLVMSERPIRDRNHIFPFSVPAHGERQLYLRFQTTSVLAILPAVLTPEQFRIKSNEQNLVFGFFYGMVLIMVAYSLGQFLILRDRIFALYALYIFSLGFFLFVYNGFAFLYLFPESTFLTNRLNPAFLGFSIFFAILFSSEYLQLRQRQRTMWLIQTGLAIVAALGVVLSFVIPYRMISFSLNVFLLFTLAVLMVSTYRNIRAGSRMAWFYLLSFSGFLISGVVVVLSNLAVFDKSVSTIYSIQAAAAIEMVILALGVSYRYRRIREEKDRLALANEISSRRLDALNTELDTARRIQSALLPEKPPLIEGLKIVSEYEPSGKLGGDYFDFFAGAGDGKADGIGGHNGEVGILIADVTGHGTPAALFASLVRYTFQTYRPFMKDPSGLLEWMNRTIYGRLGDHFLTAGYLYIDPQRHMMRYGSCGHPALLHLKADGTLVRVKGRGRAMGLIDETRPETLTSTIEKGDRLLLYTDGLEEVIEVCSKREPAIPSELDQFLISRRQDTMDELVDYMRALVIANRTGKAAIEDDITWILIEVEK